MRETLNMQPSKKSCKHVVAFIFTCLLIAPQFSSADTLIYGTNAYGKTEMVEINLTQQTSRIAGNTLFENQAVDQDPVTGYVYYFEKINAGNRFGYWDPATTTNTIVRTYTPDTRVFAKGMAFDPYGVLYIIDQNDDLYTIDINTGDLTVIGQITGLETGSYGRTGDITFAPDGTLYVFTYSSLYTVDLSTLASTRLYTNMIPGGTNNTVWTGSAYCNGLLYASHVHVKTGLSTMFRVDPATGVVNQLFDLVTWVNDISSCPVNGSPPPNNTPVAVAGGPYSGIEGELILFDGTASSDLDGDPLTYSWTLSDGRTMVGAQPSISFATAGSYTVTLVVSDGKVSSLSSTSNITIAPGPVNNPPVADAGGPYSGTTGAAVQFDGTASSDLDGDALTYSWTLSDGRTMTGAQPSISFATAGSFTVTLVVSDGQLSSVASTSSITITTGTGNTPGVPNPGGPYTGFVGVPVVFDGSGSYDVDGDPLVYGWGIPPVVYASGVSPSWTFNNPGTYTISLHVNDGTVDSAWVSTTVTIQ